jgi:hypothetical protein
MQLNIGSTDRITRIAIGLILTALAFLHILGPWAWLGVVLLATGAVGWCPPYALFGWSTCKPQSDAEAGKV